MLRHAVPIVAHFDWALAITFAAPAAAVARLAAPGLSLDTFKDRGFLAVACVATRRLRPRGLPPSLGLNFFLVGYRVFVRFDSASGHRYRGLQILGSETDRWTMAIAGGLFTHYAYRKVHAALRRDGGRIRVTTSSGLDLAVRDEAILPPASPFASWDEARRYAGPMPFTFASIRGGAAVVRIEGSRQHWEPRPTAIDAASVPFLSRLVPEAEPAAAFVVEDVDYAWEPAVVEAARS